MMATKTNLMVVFNAKQNQVGNVYEQLLKKGLLFQLLRIAILFVEMGLLLEQNCVTMVPMIKLEMDVLVANQNKDGIVLLLRKKMALQFHCVLLYVVMGKVQAQKNVMIQTYPLEMDVTIVKKNLDGIAIQLFQIYHQFLNAIQFVEMALSFKVLKIVMMATLKMEMGAILNVSKSLDGLVILLLKIPDLQSQFVPQNVEMKLLWEMKNVMMEM